MMKALLLAMLLCVVPAFANEKPQYTYQDGILQGFHREPSESRCGEGSDSSGAVAATTHNYDSTAYPSTTGSSTCTDEYTDVFTVKSGGATYILTPRGDSDETKGGLLTRAMIWHSVLQNQPPQTPIKLRSDGRHFFVKIGDRESMYSVARVE
jgi:hypothetical protein